MSDLVERAKRWVQDDPDPTTRAEIEALLGAADLGKTDLADRFLGALEFGTAGLRGVIGAGPNRMNRAVVRRTTFGLAQYLLVTHGEQAKSRGVVIGFDGRTLSREFADETSRVLAAQGIPSHVFEDFAPTPLTAFAVHRLGAAAGVMITASHNPPEYNGYKVYDANAAQIIPPVDAHIAHQIDKAPAAKDVPMLTTEEAKSSRLVLAVPESVTRAYLDAVAGLARSRGGARDLSIVYTAMHGVGNVLAMEALKEAGFTKVVSVAEQAHPDAKFPTVAFPNPEEKGAMDLAFAYAEKHAADLVLANDPDADRLAVAVPARRGDKSGKKYVQLTGNQVGVLLGHYILTHARPNEAKRLVAASIVSSPELGGIAEALGVRFESTLTGFKWIANRAMQLEHDENLSFVFGYEEALGYTVGDVVRDKDGISAAVIAAEMTAVLREQGKTILDELEAISRRFGLWVSEQVSMTKKGASGAEEIRAMMGKLRSAPPSKVGPFDVTAFVDVAAGTRVAKGGKPEPITLPKSDVLVFELAGGSRVIARPSGTEPKIKFYFDVRGDVNEGEAFADAETRAKASLAAARDAFVALADTKK
ncbi:MAG TPA: phospho-sugar mutase [Polyangiaceae bacterium]